MIVVGAGTKISALADIEDSVRGTRIVFGDDCVVDAFVKLKPAGGTGDVIIGDRCFLNSGVVLYSGNGIHLGNDVLVAANCTLAPVNHAFADPGRRITEQGFAPSRGGIVVEDDVWIGAGCILLDGAQVGQGSIISAGSVVASKLPPFGVYRGSPARLVERRDR